MGIFEKPPAALLDALEERFGFAPPRQPGFDTVDALGAMHRGEVDVFVGLGGNFVAAAPDTDVAAAAMERCALTVQVSTKLNRSHVRCGAEAIILPCLGRTERDEARRGRAVRHGRGLDGHGPRQPRRQPPGVGAAAQRGRHRVRDRGGRARRRRRRLERPGRRLRHHSRPHRRRHPGVRRLQRAGAPTGRVRPAQRPARRAGLRHRHGTGAAHGQPLRPGGRAAGPPAAADRALARPVQHHDLRARRPLPRRRAGSPRGVREPGRPRRARVRRRRGGRHRRRVARRARPPGRGVPAGRLPDGAAGAVPPTSPRRTSSCRSTAWPTTAARRRRRPSSCASNIANRRRSPDGHAHLHLCRRPHGQPPGVRRHAPHRSTRQLRPLPRLGRGQAGAAPRRRARRAAHRHRPRLRAGLERGARRRGPAPVPRRPADRHEGWHREERARHRPVSSSTAVRRRCAPTSTRACSA